MDQHFNTQSKGFTGNLSYCRESRWSDLQLSFWLNGTNGSLRSCQHGETVGAARASMERRRGTGDEECLNQDSLDLGTGEM